MRKKLLLLSTLVLTGAASCQNSNKEQTKETPSMATKDKLTLTEDQWKEKLTPEQYYVLRQKGTERPHTSPLNGVYDEGTYCCAGCGEELFTSKQKFDGHCGWPSFDGEVGGGERVLKVKDLSHGMIRTEIICAKCGGHLGHLFDDGPTSSGLRYCVNGLSLNFKKKE